MEIRTFDDNNPWHVNADLLFGFVCQNCEVQLHFDDVDECDAEDNFTESCVIISETAKAQGWTYIEDFSFNCPTCSKK